MKQHTYEVQVAWTGNQGQGTKAYKSYKRDHAITAAGKPPLLASSDPAFCGDPARYNPEELLVASLSSCHMLWYLHLCAVNGVVVTDYQDDATGVMNENRDGSGAFVEVTLHPRVTIEGDADRAKALSLHEEAHHKCFIANSVNFPVRTVAQITVAPVAMEARS
ncbi:MAG TPA: OsmC family protein [Candidatus Eremiobacteraceae bacterium]|nr:OsmC family protein [Candidatus Eremiobacteraceae bacterium]